LFFKKNLFNSSPIIPPDIMPIFIKEKKEQKDKIRRRYPELKHILLIIFLETKSIKPEKSPENINKKEDIPIYLFRKLTVFLDIKSVILQSIK